MEAQITLSPFLHCRQASDKHGEQGQGNYFITSCPFQLQTSRSLSLLPAHAPDPCKFVAFKSQQLHFLC